MAEEPVSSSVKHKIVTTKLERETRREDYFELTIPFSMIPDEIIEIMKNWDISCFDDAVADLTKEKITLYFEVEHYY